MKCAVSPSRPRHPQGVGAGDELCGKASGGESGVDGAGKRYIGCIRGAAHSRIMPLRFSSPSWSMKPWSSDAGTRS